MSSGAVQVPTPVALIAVRTCGAVQVVVVMLRSALTTAPNEGFPAAAPCRTVVVVPSFAKSEELSVKATAPVLVFTLVTGAPGIHAATLVLVIVGDPVAVLHVATTSNACVAVVSMVQVEAVCSGASPGVSVDPVPSKIQLAICVPLAPAVRVVSIQFKRQTPLVTDAI